MADHLTPTVSTAYATYTSNLMGRIDDAAAQFSSALVTQPTNFPLNTVRWNASSARWERNTTTPPTAASWTPLVATTASYTININGTVGLNGATPVGGSFTTLAASSTVSGTGFSTYLASPPAIGGTLAAAGTFSALTATTSCVLPDAARRNTVGDVVVGTTGTQTLSNKTLTAPTITSIVSGSGTLTLPTNTADTIVGRATTDTLTNKTLTTPRFASAGFIADANGNEELGFITTPSAVTYFTMTNGATGVAPALTAAGETNTSLNLKSTGTGTVQANGIVVVDLSSTQTLTNKTITGTFSGNITGNVSGNVTGNLTGNVTGNVSGSAGTATTAAGLSATLAIASGGTNSTATATAGGAGYGTGTAHAYTAAGTAGQILTSNGASAPTWGGISGTNITNGTITAAKLDSAQSGSAPIYGSRAWVNFNGATAGTFAGGATTMSRTVSTSTCNCTTTNPHGLISGNVICTNQITVSLATVVTAGPYIVTVTGANTFQITSASATSVAIPAGTPMAINTRTTRASGNVSSVAYVSAGNYYINFAVAMPDTNYAVLASLGWGAFANDSQNDATPFIGEQTLQYFKLYVQSQPDGVFSPTYINAAVIR